MAQAPLAVGRVLIPVSYLSSAAIHTAQTVAHFFLVSENESRIPKGKKPQKRVACIADRATFQADIDAAMNRCVMFSQITELSLLEEHLAPLTGPFTELDFVVQQTPVQDFIRLVSAVFKPQTSVNTVPTYTLEQGNAVSNRAHCRLAMNALQDVVGTAAQESSLRGVKAQKDRELQALSEALQKQKDESMLEMVDLHTQKETLKHSLEQAQQVLSSTRRAAKEERDMMLAKIRQLEAERDIKLGKQPGANSSSSFNVGSLAVPSPSHFSPGGGNGNSFGSPLEQRVRQEHAYEPTALGSPGQPPISTYNNNGGGLSGVSTHPQNSPGRRPLGREQLSSATYASLSPQQQQYNTPPDHSYIPNVSPSSSPSSAPIHYNTSSSPYAQHQMQRASNNSSALYSGGGGDGSYSAVNQPASSAALDQLQNQLSEGEQFLMSLQQKRAGGSGRY